MIKYAKTLTILAFAFGALGLIGGLLGAYHPAGDSIGVFRPYALAALFFCHLRLCALEATPADVFQPWSAGLWRL